MSATFLVAGGVLGGLGLAAAVILYFVAKKFYVVEDPRIGEIERLLAGANCGACGYAGCHQFAEACAKADGMDDLYCPVGGEETMCAVARILGKEAARRRPTVAVVRCQGCPEHRPKTNVYDGEPDCTLAANLYAGETGCAFGCLGLGECVEACAFGAMFMDSETELPVVIEEKCTACGACVKACPRGILEMRPRGPKGRRVYVACVNIDRGAEAKKACAVACIGCMKCVKVCDRFQAITVENFLAYIDPEKCRLCRKCVEVCPTTAIVAVNFPPLKKRPAVPETASTAQPSSIGEG